MVKKRIIETNEGIQGEFDVGIYDQMQRRMRDKGWMETDLILKKGMVVGEALEIGPGPGYLGLEWLKATDGTLLTGLEISGDMIVVAQRNAGEYGFLSRTKYVQGNCIDMPFLDGSFDMVFTNGSLHEWEAPQKVFDEIYRVLKPGGKFLISDLRRDMNPLVKGMMWLMAGPKEIRPGLKTSIDAAYTPNELNGMLAKTTLKGATVKGGWIGVVVSGQK